MKIFAFLLLCAPAAFAAEFGTFMLVKGKVIIINTKSESAEAKVSSKIFVGETVVTDNDSRAKIIMSDRNVLNILPNTKLKIEKYTNEANNKEVQLNLIQGKVRSNVGEKYDNQSSKFEIRTATAVAGVRGTEFITSYDAATKVTEVLTIHGQVIFKSVIANMPDAPEVLVNKQEKSEQKGEAAPSKPVKVPKKEFDAISKDSNVSGDKKSDNKKGGKNAADSVEVTDGAVQGGQVSTTPIGDLNKAPTTGIQAPIPVKTNTRVNVIIK
jgi:hypothetical protein